MLQASLLNRRISMSTSSVVSDLISKTLFLHYLALLNQSRLHLFKVFSLVTRVLRLSKSCRSLSLPLWLTLLQPTLLNKMPSTILVSLSLVVVSREVVGVVGVDLAVVVVPVVLNKVSYGVSSVNVQITLLLHATIAFQVCLITRPDTYP
ncbi:hypothetical protein NL676_005770 [Syzygium grande]|nr:hypothetical protein NL676_005770 [Syzygium grande]